MKKIIYVSISPLIPFIQRYLRIQEVIDSGFFEVEYWDLSTIYFKGSSFPGALNKEYVRRIDSLVAFKNRLTNEDLTGTVFVLQVYFEWRVLSLYHIMSRLGCKTANFPWVTNADIPLSIRIIDNIRPKKILRACLNMSALAIKKMGFVKEYDLVFAAGRSNREAYKNHDRIVNINYLDYDQYLACLGTTNRFVQGGYCVFLDEGCVDNPNVKTLKLERMDPDKFYGALRRFFDHIEKSFNLKVVIAAHPGIPYDRNIFGNRDIYEGKTCELVKDASMVISQSSTATSFAVFYKKPLLFVYTDEYALTRRVSFRTLEFLAHELGARAYNIDRDTVFGPLEAPVIDHVLYDDYMYKSFTSKETQHKSSKEIIVASLMEL